MVARNYSAAAKKNTQIYKGSSDPEPYRQNKIIIPFHAA